MKNKYSKYSVIFKALSDSTRLEIIFMLSSGELCACEIQKAFDITQPTLSYHMKVLSDTGLINAFKDGPWVKYSLNKDNKVQLMKFLSLLLNENDYERIYN